MIILNNKILKDFIQMDENKNRSNNSSILFHVGDKVYKILAGNENTNKKSLSMVNNFLNNFKNVPLKEIVCPEELISYNDKIIGYSMKYVHGVTLEEYLMTCSIEDARNIFKNILKSINRINVLGMNICDLHERNIIVDENNYIHFIDVDTFSYKDNQFLSMYVNLYKLMKVGTIDSSYVISLLDDTNISSNKNLTEEIKINKSTDMFCLLCMIIDYIMSYDKSHLYRICDLNIEEFLLSRDNTKNNRELVLYIRKCFNNINDTNISEDTINHVFDNMEEFVSHNSKSNKKLSYFKKDNN